MESGIYLLKKKSKKNPSNYGEISVSNIISRLYGRILSGLIEKEYRNLKEEELSGFRSGRFCTDQYILSKISNSEKNSRELRDSYSISKSRASKSI